MLPADVAVIIPVYNRATTVLHTLLSVANQSMPPRQLIVVDDGSTDDTAAAVSQWAATVQDRLKVKVICQANQGAGAARNRGLEAIEGCRYVAFLDSDDRWPADFIRRAVTRLDADGSAVAATADRTFFRKRTKRPGNHSSRRIEKNPSTWLMTHSAGIASCTLFRTDVVQRLGGFDSAIPTGQDAELFLRISKEGAWLHLPGAPVNFYIGFSGTQGEESNLSFKYADRKRRWVQIRERFIFRQRGRDVVPRRVYLRALGKMWHKAGQDYVALGRNVLGAACFRKALVYQPLRISSWWRYLKLAATIRRDPNRRPSAARPAVGRFSFKPFL
jgi:glycosyltransferase involved in cell wall biosynthesis